MTDVSKIFRGTRTTIAPDTTGAITGAVIGTSSATSTNTIDLRGGSLVAIDTPSDIKSIASITLTTCETSGGTFTAVKDNAGNALTFTLSTSSRLMVLPSQTAGLSRYIKLVGNAAATGSSATFVVYVRDVE